MEKSVDSKEQSENSDEEIFDCFREMYRNGDFPPSECPACKWILLGLTTECVIHDKKNTVA